MSDAVQYANALPEWNNEILPDPPVGDFTLADYEAYEGPRIEVIRGIVYDMASPSRVHQTILMELSAIIRDYLRKKGGDCSVFPAPFDVLLEGAPLSMVQPDVMVVCDKNKLDDKRCNGAPDFVIEIVSPSNSSYDYIDKLRSYHIAGVREYWIVDPRTKTITVYYFEEDLVCRQYDFSSKVKVNIYDDLWIDFSEILPLL